MSALPNDVAELVKRLNWANEERNNLVHSIWDASETRPDTILRSKKAVRVNGLKAISEHVSPDELSELSDLFEGIVTDLFWLTATHFPKASLQGYRKRSSPITTT
jgi:hypothetical protein